jgi:hypothetical protein
MSTAPLVGARQSIAERLLPSKPNHLKASVVSALLLVSALGLVALLHGVRCKAVPRTASAANLLITSGIILMVSPLGFAYLGKVASQRNAF